MTHSVQADHRVVTRGSAGDIIAVTSWPSHSAAFHYALRISNTLGGKVIDETLVAA